MTVIALLLLEIGKVQSAKMCLINHFAFQVAGVTVQGDENADDWVTKYYVQFSDDGNSFTTYQKPDGSSEVSVASFSQKRANCFRL